MKTAKKLLKTAEAFFTVEASILIPFLIAMLFILIYVCIFEYDRALLSQDTQYLSVKAREAYMDGKDVEKELNKVMKTLSESSPYISCGELKVKYSKKRTKISVNSSIDFQVPIGFFTGIWFKLFDGKLSDEKSESITKAHSVMRMAYFPLGDK